VKQSGGSIWVYSEPGRGTTFKIYLPYVVDNSEVVEFKVIQPELSMGTETILLVEDEDVVRDMTCEVLHESGYEVLEARDPREALSIAEQFPGAIHLMLTDVVMPVMSGRQLTELLIPKRPEMQVLYMSGYTDDAIVHHGVLGQGTAFIGKPFAADELTRKIREILDSVTVPT
jgi:CheY-like chemotaxis protein